MLDMSVLPESVRAFLVRGGGLADHAVYAHWDGTGEETAPRTIAVGAPAIGRLLERDGPRHPEVLACICEGADCFLEGRMTGALDASFAASVQLDRAGLIRRWLSFHCPPVEGSTTWDVAGLDGEKRARPVLDRYFGALSTGDFPAAAGCFSSDCLYSHPPYRPGMGRVEFRGRAELLAGFTDVRGESPVRQIILRCVQQGRDCFVEGIAGGGSFVSSLALDDEGLIRRYVAFYCATRVRRQ